MRHLLKLITSKHQNQVVRTSATEKKLIRDDTIHLLHHNFFVLDISLKTQKYMLLSSLVLSSYRVL